MRLGKTIARLWARCAGDDDGVILGVALRNEDDSCPFEPNTIYELVRCPLSEDIVLRKVGRAPIKAGEDVHPVDPDIEWLKDRGVSLPHIAEAYADIATSHQSSIVLSAKELRARIEFFSETGGAASYFED